MMGNRSVLGVILVGLLSSRALAGDMTVEESGTAPARKIIVTSPGVFKAVVWQGSGGGINEFYDLCSDPEAKKNLGTAWGLFEVGWHGAAYEALMLCEALDDGSFTIPGDLITELPRAANGMEQHSSCLARVTREEADTDAGPIELVVSSQVRIPQLSH